jgi:hypothetical protein
VYPSGHVTRDCIARSQRSCRLVRRDARARKLLQEKWLERLWTRGPAIKETIIGTRRPTLLRDLLQRTAAPQDGSRPSRSISIPFGRIFAHRYVVTFILHPALPSPNVLCTRRTPRVSLPSNTPTLARMSLPIYAIVARGFSLLLMRKASLNYSNSCKDLSCCTQPDTGTLDPGVQSNAG